MLGNFRIAVVLFILLVASVPAYARNILRHELRDAQLKALSLNEDPKMAVDMLEQYQELKTSDLVQGGLQCLSEGLTCYFMYPELCCSGMCKLTPHGPFGTCLGN